MKFRDDIDPETTWVTSDTHFGHKNIGDLCHSPEDREQIIIAEWRKEVPDDATVLHLGDLVFSNNSFFKNIIAKELTGARKLLILGNHDHQRFSFYKAAGFKIAQPFVFKVFPTHDGGLKITSPNDESTAAWTISFAHYPWNEEEEGSMPPRTLRVHGHIHNIGYTRDAFVPFLRDHINISVEQTRFAPVNLKLLLDAVLLGKFPATTEAQLEEARARKEANLKAKKN
jgi:calcineurin-like phosphoesterase family protein